MAKKSKEQVQGFSIPVNSPTDYYFAGVPYKLPDDEELDYLANFRELTDDIKNGAGWLYRNNLKGSPYSNPFFEDKWTNYKFFTSPDGRVWYAANDSWKGELPAGYREISYRDVRKMLPKRDYFGGSGPADVRLRAVRQIPGLWGKIRERAGEYGVDPNLLLHRLMQEGYIDQVVDRYNYGVPVAEQEDYWDRLWDEENLSGFDSFGLDNAATLLNEGKFSLHDPNSSWGESENVNEKGRVVHSADPANLASALDIMAAQLGYNQGEVNRLYKPSKGNLGTWTNASYNMGLYNDKLKDSSYVTGKYAYPDYFGRYGEPPRQQGIVLNPELGIGVLAPINEPSPSVAALLLSQSWTHGKSLGGLIDRYGADAVRSALNTYKSGGKIHIKDSKKGTFTAAAKKHDKSVQAFASQALANKDNYSPAMVKKANFARNSSKWHTDGGFLEFIDD